MTGLHYALKQKCKHGLVKLNELRPNSRQIAERLLQTGELWKDDKGFLRVVAE